MRYVLLMLVFQSISCTAPKVANDSGPRPPASEQNVERILLDTDSAVFWDDGAALAMLLTHPEKIKIEGITLVLGNHWPNQGAEYIARVLKVFGRSDIPMYLGANEPLNNSKAQLEKLEQSLIASRAVEKTGFWKGAFSRPSEVMTREQVQPAKGEALTGIFPRDQDAISFIIETLKNSPAPMTFVALGPLTNLATALRKDKSIARKIKRLLIMGGSISTKGNTTPHAELNFLIDPEAARIVLESPIHEMLLFPLDATDQVKIGKAQFDELTATNTPLSKMLSSDRGPKFQDPSYVLQAWDTTVAAYLLDPFYVTAVEDMKLKVIDKFGPEYGRLKLDKKSKKKVRVVTKIDERQFFEILKSNLSGP